MAIEVLHDIENVTQTEFRERISRGEKLVILDEFVVDVGEFMSKHPGGQFLIEHNIGRDISKYFYGGYSMDGNLGRDTPRAGVKHSNHARKIVN